MNVQPMSIKFRIEDNYDDWAHRKIRKTQTKTYNTNIQKNKKIFNATTFFAIQQFIRSKSLIKSFRMETKLRQNEFNLFIILKVIQNRQFFN